MKKSQFNYIKKVKEDVILIYNSLSGALSVLDENTADFLNKDDYNYSDLSNYWKKILDQCKTNGYLVEKETDELQQLEFLQYINRFDTSELSMVIAPTMDCNFACPYCFENRVKGTMSKEIQDMIIEFVKNSQSISKISITWYGGEPTLCLDIIEKVSKEIVQFANSKGIKVGQSMISNGYLFDDRQIDRIKVIGISRIQITLDGTAEIHNRRRCLRNGDETYAKIVKNIYKLQQKQILVNIRVNVDSTNSHNVFKLIENLKINRVDVSALYLAYVEAMNDKTDEILPSCINQKEFVDLNIKFSKLLAGENIDYLKNIYPHFRLNYCGANKMNTYVIDPKGNFYKCWNDIGFEERAIFNIKDRENINYKIMHHYIVMSPFRNDKCKSCCFLPICMGNCPSLGKKSGCETTVKAIDSILEEKYYQLSQNNNI